MLLSGCSAASVEELLSPPRLDGEQTEIYDALRSCTNGDIILKYPKSGQFRSAFVVKNLDNEPTDEAIVFYETPNVSDGSSLRLNFLDKQNGSWVSVYDFAASGSEVESVRFEDIGLGTETIIVNYLLQSSSDRYTSVMTYSGGTPKELLNIRNIFMEMIDADGNGTGDLFAVSNERVSGNTMAKIYGVRDGALSQLGSVLLNSGFAGIRSAFCGKCGSNDTHAIFVDYAFSDGSAGTDAVIYGNGYFYLSPALDPDITERSTNTFTPYIPSRDIDGDGKVEIPSGLPFPEYEDLPRAEQVNMTLWHSLERGGTVMLDKYRSFVGTKGDYVFLFPENWGSVTAAVSVAESMVVFNRYDSISGVKGEELMRIYAASDENTDKYATGEYIFLGRSDPTGSSYYAQLTSSPLSPEKDELAKLFIIQ